MNVPPRHEIVADARQDKEIGDEKERPPLHDRAFFELNCKLPKLPLVNLKLLERRRLSTTKQRLNGK